MFLTLKKQFQNKLDSSLKILVNIPIYSESKSGDRSKSGNKSKSRDKSKSGNRSKSQSRAISRGQKSRSQRAIALGRDFQNITGKFIIRQVYKKINARIGTGRKPGVISISSQNVTKLFLMG